MLRMIRLAEIRVSLGAIGTRYASLAHLKRLHVDAIARSGRCVSHLRCDAGNRATIEAMVGMVRNLAVKVVAEGIETAVQTRLLRDRGGDVGLGLLFGKGVAAYRVLTLLVASVLSNGAASGDDRADLASAGHGGM